MIRIRQLRYIQTALIISTLLLVAAPVSSKEVRYVTDVLKLSVHEQPGSKGKRLKKISSGDKLSVLARKGNYAKIKTASGTTGWVKSAFLTKRKPAAARLREFESKINDHDTIINAAKARLLQEEVKSARLKEKLNSIETKLNEKTSQLQNLSVERLELMEESESNDTQIPLQWVAGIAIATLIMGFIGGLWWVDLRMRRRHGGFRVY